MIHGNDTFKTRFKLKMASLATILIGSAIFTVLLYVVLIIAHPFLPNKVQDLLALIGDGNWRDSMVEVVSFFDSLGGQKKSWFILLNVAQAFFAPIPGQVTGFLGGLMFGFVDGLLLTMLGMSAGSLMAMLFSRYFRLAIVGRFVSTNLYSKLKFLLEAKSVSPFLIIFLLPAMPDDAACFIGGLTNIRLSTLFAASIIGRLPGMMIVVFAGANVAQNTIFTQVAIFLGAGLSFIIWLFDEEVKHKLRNGW